MNHFFGTALIQYTHYLQHVNRLVHDLIFSLYYTNVSLSTLIFIKVHSKSLSNRSILVPKIQIPCIHLIRYIGNVLAVSVS